jgi:hypothetical protein
MINKFKIIKAGDFMNYYIFKDGKPSISIALAEDATEQENYAAAELRYYLGMMTAATFEIVKGASSSPVIALGKAAEKLSEAYDKNLGEDGFLLRTKGDSLAIVGGKRGVIYGMYELLEKMGCRFFTPLCEKIPTYKELLLPNLFPSKSVKNLSKGSPSSVIKTTGSFPSLGSSTLFL